MVAESFSVRKTDDGGFIISTDGEEYKTYIATTLQDAVNKVITIMNEQETF